MQARTNPMTISRHRCDKCDCAAIANGTPLPEGWHQHRSTSTQALLTICGPCDEKTAGAGRSQEGASASDDQLRLFVERVERLEEDSRGIRDDIKDVYLEMKSQGYDPKLVKLIVKERAMAPHDRKEREAILEVYRCSLGLE